MADTQTYYDSTLTGPELDAALQKLPQVDEAVKQAEQSAILARSWAEGSTGLREEESLHNAKYWCEQAQTIANGCLGWFADPADLQGVYPVGQNGQWAILGSTDTVWIWDSDRSGWVNSGEKPDLSGYYTAEQTRSVIPFLYKATFLLDGWIGDGPFTQTVALEPVNGGPEVTADSVSVTAGIDNTLPEVTKAILRAAVSSEEKPDVDVELYFWVKKGGE